MKKFFFIFLFFLSLPFVSIGKPLENLSDFSKVNVIKNISMDNGLPHNFVEEIYQDKNGFIWIATSGALSRYDGFHFDNFTTNSANQHLKSNFVKKVVIH